MAHLETQISLSALCKRTQLEIDQMSIESLGVQDALHEAVADLSISNASVVMTLQSLDRIHQKLAGLSQALDFLSTLLNQETQSEVSLCELRKVIQLESLADSLCASLEAEVAQAQHSQVTLF